MFIVPIFLILSNIPGVENFGPVAGFKDWVNNTIIVKQQNEYDFVDYYKNPLSGCNGLIIDASDKGYKPSVIFSIKDSDGNVIYDPTMIPYELTREAGTAILVSSIEKALNLDQSGSNPMVIKAVYVDPEHPGDIIIKPIDRINILKALAQDEIFRYGSLIIVID